MMNSPFGLREEPFDIEDPLRAPFASADHKEAFNGFFLAIMARKRVMALFGETGMGKTTLLRSLIRHIEADGAVVLATTARPGMNVDDLILSARPDIEPEAVSDTADPEALEALVNEVEERIENAGTGLLVVDEAHLLDLPVLTDLIELASSDTETGRYLQVLIAGDHKLERKLAEPELEAAFRQYGAVHYLPPLDRDAAEAFIRDRLRLAGAPQLDMFLPSAVDVATQLSAGLPGVLGAICGQALRIAAQARRHRVDASHVQEAATALGIETAPDIEIDIPDPALYAEVREPMPASSAPARGAPAARRAAGTEQAPRRPVDPPPAPPPTRGMPSESEPPAAEAEADPWPELSAPRREDAYEDERRPKTRARWVAAGLAVVVLAAGAGLALSLTEPGTLRSFYTAETDAPRPVAGPAPVAENPADAGAAEERMAAAPSEPLPSQLLPSQPLPSRSVPNEPAAPTVPADSIAVLPPANGDSARGTPPGPTAFVPVAPLPSAPPPAAAAAPSPPPAERGPAPETLREVARLVDLAERQIADKLLTTPAGDNAFETYGRIVALIPDSPEAAAILDEIKDTYLSWAATAEERGGYEDARRFYERALSVDPDDAEVAQRLRALDEAEADEAEVDTAVAPPASQPDPGTATRTGPDEPEGTEQAAVDPVASGQVLRLPPDYVEPSDDGSTVDVPPAPEPVATRPNGFTDRDDMLAAVADPDVLEAVIAAGHDLDHELADGKTALMLAAERGRSEAVGMLLEAGAAPNARSRNGGTALMYAAGIGDDESIRILVRHGGAVNAMNVDGKTALMAAAQGRHTDTVRLLLDSGADMDARTVQGRTALDYAEEAGDQASATLLRLRGARSGQVSPTAIQRDGAPRPSGPIDLRAFKG